MGLWLLTLFQAFITSTNEANIWTSVWRDLEWSKRFKWNPLETNKISLNEKIFTIGYGIFFCHLIPKVNVFFYFCQSRKKTTLISWELLSVVRNEANCWDGCKQTHQHRNGVALGGFLNCTIKTFMVVCYSWLYYELFWLCLFVYLLQHKTLDYKKTFFLKDWKLEFYVKKIFNTY